MRAVVCQLDPEYWFTRETADHAKRVCADCWYRTECAERVSRIPPGHRYGVWAGVAYAFSTATTRENRAREREGNKPA